MKRHDKMRLEAIGANLRAILDERKTIGEWYTIAALAEHSGLSEAGIDKILHARQNTVTYETLEALSDALRVPVAQLTMTQEERQGLEAMIQEYEKWANHTLTPAMRRSVRSHMHTANELGEPMSLPSINALVVAKSM